MDINRAHEVTNGVITNPDENTDGPFYTGGPLSPVGLDLPERTLYVQNAAGGVLIWRKFGTLASEWRQLSSEDIPFDPTGLLNLDPTDVDLQLAVEKLGNQSVSDLTEAEGFVSNAQEMTTSDGWVSKTGFPIITINDKTSGLFSLRWFAQVGQTKASRNFGFRVLWRPLGGVWAPLAEIQATVTRDDNVFMQSGFKEVTLPTTTKIEMDVQHGQTTDGFSSIIENVSVEIRRISD